MISRQLHRLRQTSALRWLVTATKHRRLPVALGLAVMASLVLTFVSVYLYSSGGFSRFDLSRPGYEQEREEVVRAEPQKTYDTSSPVTPQVINDFLQEFDTRTHDLTTYGGFSADSLSDEELQIAP